MLVSQRIAKSLLWLRPAPTEGDILLDLHYFTKYGSIRMSLQNRVKAKMTDLAVHLCDFLIRNLGPMRIFATLDFATLAGSLVILYN